VGIATKGRAAVLKELLHELRNQSRPADRIVVCYTTPQDIVGSEGQPGVDFLVGQSGSCIQRNVILDAVEECDVVLFLDDDFLPARRYLEATLAALRDDPNIVMTTGAVIADGATGPGLSPEQGRAFLKTDAYAAAGPDISPAWNGYGCNMAVRLAPTRDHGLRFDPRLPLYAWYEDVDFSRRLARHGKVVKVQSARGVHLGTKSGRTSGKRLGYSQVANPVYLALKGSYTWRRAAWSIGKHLIINTVRSAWPEPWVDRRGRMAGNCVALLDLVRGQVTPERILSF
jgi:glycosyltransferase involved in cell wall biosynthesis